MNKITVFIIVLALLVFGGIYVFSRNSETSQVPNVSNTNNVPTPTSQAQSQVKEVSVEAGSFYFKPSEITVKKGEKVKIVMRSVSLMHNFTVDELNVQLPIVKNGDTGTVEFIPDRVGTFEYYCSVGEHRQNGQAGKLIVTE